MYVEGNITKLNLTKTKLKLKPQIKFVEQSAPLLKHVPEGAKAFISSYSLNPKADWKQIRYI